MQLRCKISFHHVRAKITRHESFTTLGVTNEAPLMTIPVDTGRKLNVHKTFNLRPVSTGAQMNA